MRVFARVSDIGGAKLEQRIVSDGWRDPAGAKIVISVIVSVAALGASVGDH